MSMRIVAISDTHSKHGKVTIPECDLLIHAGDATWRGTLPEMESFAQWLETQPARHKVFVPGNHELVFKDHLPHALEWVTRHCPSLHILIDQSLEIEGIKLYGSPWQPEFFGWAWNLPRGLALAEKWALIPEDVDILITHTPPYGILDMSAVPSGCEALRERLENLNPQVHIFGHIHESYGHKRIGDTHYYNVSICDKDCRPINAVTVIKEINVRKPLSRSADF
jgi:Icc-related predicted phosphoesterase